MFRALCAHHQVKIVLYSIWYHHTCRWPSGAQVERGLSNSSVTCGASPRLNFSHWRHYPTDMPRMKLIHRTNSITSTNHTQTLSHTLVGVINKKLGVFVEREVETARLASEPVTNTEVASVLKGIQTAVNQITQRFCILHFQSNTTIFHLVQWEYNDYMFRPYRWAIFRL